MKKFLLLSTLCSIYFIGSAQDKWDLRRCVEYAVANNISVKQADVQARISELTLKQSKLSQIPTLGFGTNLSYNAGYTQNPQTFALVTSGLFYNSYSLQSNINVYNFGNLRNTIASNHFAFLAANANTEKLKNDISLNVANAYLSFLQANEQMKLAALQLSLSQSQLENTRKQVAAGTLPELNAAELESQVAQDSSAYVTAKSTLEQQALSVKAYLSLDAAAPFDLETPPVESIPLENLADLQPKDVYELALKNQPLQKYDALLIQSAQKTVLANKAALLPTFSLFGGLSSTYTNQAMEANGFIQYPGARIGSVKVNGTDYSVISDPYNAPLLRKQPYGSQLNQAFRQSIGLSVNIPIFNSGTLRTNYEKSKLNVKNNELQQQSDNLALKQNIYLAYAVSVSAYEKFKASKIAVDATQRSYEFAQKRYDVGMLNTIDLITNQNNYFKAKVNMLSAQFDYVFKMKVLEFYKGMGIKL
ncbi:MAG: TolC family protein [Bacteroidetes bacterium]|nr:TolC family protein [Bacteroidota bacterium]